MKKLSVLLLSFFSIFFMSLLCSNSVFANTFTGTYYTERSYGTQGEGAPYLVEAEPLGFRNIPSTYPDNNGTIFGREVSSIVNVKMFGIYVGGFNFAGQDSTLRFQNANASFMFVLAPAAYSVIHRSSIQATYFSVSGANDRVVSYTSSATTDSIGNSFIYVECPNVSNSSYDPYDHVDLLIGTLRDFTFDSDYFVNFRDSNGLYFYYGEYSNSASDDPQLNAIESQTNAINDGFNRIQDSIEQQQQQDQQDRQDFQNQSNDSSDTADDLSDDVANASSSLLVIIGNFVNIVLNPPQSDCVITLDVGNANFGQADLCHLSLPQPLAVIGTLFILGFIITFTVSLIMTFLSLLKGATQ